VIWLTDLCNLIAAERKIPYDRECNVLLAVFKGKGDPVFCSCRRTVMWLEHAISVMERVSE